jgi:hypothetical protein
MFSDFPNSSRLWIYASTRIFDDHELPALRQSIKEFARQWTSHQVQMRADAEILHNRFIVLIADESRVGTGGCSIDKSVSFLKGLQAEFETDFFNRMIFSYIDGYSVKSVSREEFAKLYADGIIDEHTQVVDTLVSNKEDFDHGFVKLLCESWHKRMV